MACYGTYRVVTSDVMVQTSMDQWQLLDFIGRILFSEHVQFRTLLSHFLKPLHNISYCRCPFRTLTFLSRFLPPLYNICDCACAFQLLPLQLFYENLTASPSRKFLLLYLFKRPKPSGRLQEYLASQGVLGAICGTGGAYGRSP